MAVPESAARAEAAARAVMDGYGGRALRLPGTHLGRVQVPAPPGGGASGPWHYWWQAHYLDALLDRAERLRAASESREADRTLRRARQLQRGILIRNGLRWVNSFYDDMAWLALATDRLGSMTGRDGAPAALTAALRSAHTADLGGGLWWNRDRNYKNAAATGPAALHFARIGERGRARELTGWLAATLLSPESRLYRDGVRLREGRPAVDAAVYSYNQGPVLGALLALGRPAELDAAGALVEAVAAQLASPAGVLRSHDGGDGGLFTGILVRYLALAATDARLPERQRATAARLVRATGEALWAGRRSAEGLTVFARHADRSAEADYPPGTAVHLSTQLQAWTVLEAAARLDGGPVT